MNNVITALTSNQMIAPSFWVDPKSGNDYMLTVQYPENRIRNLLDLRGIPLHGERVKDPTLLDAVTKVTPIDVADRDRSLPDPARHRHLREPGRRGSRHAGERHPPASWPARTLPAGVKVDMRGMVQGMQQSFTSFGLGLILALVLLYLILVAQFRSFVDPLLILLAVPTGPDGRARRAVRHAAPRSTCSR